MLIYFYWLYYLKVLKNIFIWKYNINVILDKVINYLILIWVEFIVYIWNCDRIEFINKRKFYLVK